MGRSLIAFEVFGFYTCRSRALALGLQIGECHRTVRARIFLSLSHHVNNFCAIQPPGRAHLLWIFHLGVFLNTPRFCRWNIFGADSCFGSRTQMSSNDVLFVPVWCTSISRTLFKDWQTSKRHLLIEPKRF